MGRAAQRQPPLGEANDRRNRSQEIELSHGPPVHSASSATSLSRAGGQRVRCNSGTRTSRVRVGASAARIAVGVRRGGHAADPNLPGAVR